MIGVALPTRGMVFTRVEMALEECRKDHEIRVYRSHDLPIPDGHNSLAEQALLDGCSHVLFIEEDTVPSAGSLEKLIQANSDVACIDYGVSGWGCVTRNTEGEILWCGLGCTLVKRAVLETLPKPWFRVDKALRLNDWSWISLPTNYVATRNYGQLDIWFCWQARKFGFVITQVEGECDHLQLDALGVRGSNHGLHTISSKPKISQKQILNEKEVNT